MKFYNFYKTIFDTLFIQYLLFYVLNQLIEWNFNLMTNYYQLNKLNILIFIIEEIKLQSQFY